MAATDFIIAIELGSSKITGIAGKKNSDGSLQVVACIKEDSPSFIRKGIIYNLDKTAQSLTSIINQLEAILDVEIAKVYVGIGGKSLRSIKNTIIRHLDGEENAITEKLVNEINDENRNTPILNMEILEVVPQEYKIGNNYLTEPVGVLGTSIEGRFLNIIARNDIKTNIEKAFKQANIEIADFFISPLALADVVLTDSEKRSGCALVDLGANTTTVSIYKNNILRHLAVIPLGGESITRDISSLYIEEKEAESLKINYGNAINTPTEEGEEPELITLQDNRTIEVNKLNDIIEARTEEIIANVWNQIQSTSYESQLLAGIILTGGGANLKGIEDSFRKNTKIEKIKRVKDAIIGVNKAENNLLSPDGSDNTILGILYNGEYNCCKAKEPEKLDTLIKEAEAQEQLRRAESENERKREEEEKAAQEKALKEKQKQEKDKKSKDKIEKAKNWLGKLFDDSEMSE